MKKLSGILMLLVMAHIALSQTTITYKGQNYWGGAYVAPQWTKTYKDYSPTSSSSSSSYSSPNYGSKSSYSSGSSSSSYEYKPKKGYTYDPDRIRAQIEEEERLKRYRNEKANTQAKLYFAKIEEAKNLMFKEKLYSNANMALTYSLAEIYKTVENGTSVFDEFADLIKDSYDEKDYYLYLARTKLGYYDLAIQHYNYYYTIPRERNLTLEQSTKMLPLTAENYYFLGDTLGDYFFKSGKLTLTPQDRLRIDLFFVHSLIGKGQKEDAKKAFNKIIEFYNPIVPDMSYVADEMAIICFNLGEMDLAQKNVEYYCEHNNSNFYRYRLMTALVEDEGWDGHNNPKAIEFLERNLIFLEDLQRASTTEGSPAFYDREWNTIYRKKSNNTKAYVARVKEFIKLTENDTSLYAISTADYLIALMEIKDEAEINWVLQKFKKLGEIRAKRSFDWNQSKLDELLAENKGRVKEKNPSYYLKDYYESLWHRYYEYQARPTLDMLEYFNDFFLGKFYDAGGCRYVKPIIAEYDEFLSQFTQEELDYFNKNSKCFKLGGKKSRSYPKVFDPPAVKISLPK